MVDYRLVSLLKKILKNVDSPLSAACSTLLEKGQWAEIQKLRVDPRVYVDSPQRAEAYWKDSMFVELFRKCKLPLGLDTRKAAVANFYACEAQNAATNARLYRFLPQQGGFGLTPQEWRLHEFFVKVRKEIRQVLGPLPGSLVPRFSNGATLSTKRRYASIPDKIASDLLLYPQTVDLMPFFWRTSWGRSVRDNRIPVSVVRGNRFFTVPKDSEKDRGCCVEAPLNVSFQLDVGRHLRERLLTVLGIDLTNAEAEHKHLAQLSSLFGEDATIDSSNASDTVCRALVELCFPADWYQLLDSLRAHFTDVDGKWIKLEKFSSMGNGFTFELETILFLCLARVVVTDLGGNPDRVRCYGDDLIVPADCAQGVTAMMRFCGFTLNERKTFLEGPFRESCGGDFYDGVPVRAHYLKEPPVEPADWIKLANGLRRACAGDEARWAFILPAWRYVVSQIPADIRKCRGPVHLGDIVIHDDPEQWSTKYIRERSSHRLPPSSFGPGPKVLHVRTWSPVGVSYSLDRWDTNTAYASVTLVGPEVSRPGNVTGYTTKYIPALQGSTWLPS